jgi:hypothetical protein
MHHSIIFFVTEQKGIRCIAHQDYVLLVRNQRPMPEYAKQAVRVADWYVRTSEAGPAIVDNETYSIFSFDEQGLLNWSRCRQGVKANHALYKALDQARKSDSDKDKTVERLRAEMGEQFTWLPDAEEVAAMYRLLSNVLST